MHWKGANSMAMSGFSHRKASAGTPFDVNINGLIKSLLQGLHFQISRPLCQLCQVGISLLISGCESHIRMTCFFSSPTGRGN